MRNIRTFSSEIGKSILPQAVNKAIHWVHLFFETFERHSTSVQDKFETSISIVNRFQKIVKDQTGQLIIPWRNGSALCGTLLASTLSLSYLHLTSKKPGAASSQACTVQGKKHYTKK